MLLSLLFLGVALVVLGMWRRILLDAWRTRSLSEEGSPGAPAPGSSGEETRAAARPSSVSDCGYDSVLPDRLVTRHGAVVSLADHDEALL